MVALKMEGSGGFEIYLEVKQTGLEDGMEK